MDWDKASAQLNKKLDPAAIKPAPKGKFGDYVDGHHVVSEANRIFGNGGWSYEITRLLETHRGVFTLQGNSGPYDQFRCSFLCTVKVHVGDTFKEGSAVGMGAGKPENIGDVIESAVKEAETDALKRALRTYGNTFGLALYDKSRENVGVDFDAQKAAEHVEQALLAAPDLPGLAAAWKKQGELLADINHARPDLAQQLTTLKDFRKAQFAPKGTAS